jgi:hypothetical protein
MEGSAISRTVKGPMGINQSADPDGDGVLLQRPTHQTAIGNSVTKNIGIGQDNFHEKDSYSKISIKGGQSV